MRTPLTLAAVLAAAAASAVTLDFDDAVPLLNDRSNEATASTLDDRYNGIILSYFRGETNGVPDPYVPVTAISYADYFLPAVSAPNALDGSLGSVIVDLNPAVFPLGSTFGISVVDQGFGNPNAQVKVFDAAGVQIDAVALDLGRPGRFVYSAKPFASIQLPSGAFYDDLTVTPVPEPTSFAALAVGALGLARRRRR